LLELKNPAKYGVVKRDSESVSRTICSDCGNIDVVRLHHIGESPYAERGLHLIEVFVLPRIPAMNVLIVDDTAMVRVLVKRNLIALGLRAEEILEAEDGEKGLARFKTFQCRGIITDMRMPVMDGLEFVKEVRKLDCEVPIVMLTSANDREDVVAAIESGVNDYLIKPFAPGDIKKKLRKMLAQMQQLADPQKQLTTCGL
jgi:two-component system chemotaxis response regulator CheY